MCKTNSLAKSKLAKSKMTYDVILCGIGADQLFTKTKPALAPHNLVIRNKVLVYIRQRLIRGWKELIEYRHKKLLLEVLKLNKK